MILLDGTDFSSKHGQGLIRVVQRGRAHSNENDLHFRGGGNGELYFTSIGRGRFARRVAVVQFGAAFCRTEFFVVGASLRCWAEPKLFERTGAVQWSDPV